MNENLILITGYAQLPKGTTLYEKNKIIGVSLVIDCEEKIIKDSEFTFLTKLNNEFLKLLVKEYDLSKGLDPLYEEIKKRCIMPSQGAVIQALRGAWDRYQEYKN